MSASPSRPRRLLLATCLGISALGAALRTWGLGTGELRWFFADLALFLAILGFALGAHAGLRRVGSSLRLGRKGRVAFGVLHLGLLLLLPGTFALAGLTLFPPHLAPWGNPEEHRLPAEQVVLEGDGMRLVGWYVPARGVARGGVVIAHGIGGSRSDSLPGAMVAHRFGFASVLVDLPGHGESSGLGSTFGIREARALRLAHDWIKAKAPERPVHAIGYSMGGAAVLRAAALDGIFEKVVVDSTFGSLERVARQTRLFVFGPFEGLAWQAMRLWALLFTGRDLGAETSEEMVRRLHRPLLVIHGTRDRTVPFSESEALLSAAGPFGERLVVEGADHLATITDPAYSNTVGAFLIGEAEQGASR